MNPCSANEVGLFLHVLLQLVPDSHILLSIRDLILLYLPLVQTIRRFAFEVRHHCSGFMLISRPCFRFASMVGVSSVLMFEKLSSVGVVHLEWGID